MASQPSSSPIGVTALPNLKNNPSYNALVSALQGLALQPTTWSESQNTEDESTEANDPNDINKFLLAVISSDLAWFDGKLGSTDVSAKKDEVFGMASKRMAERCGRSAMPEMTRVWVIPATVVHPEFQFAIREPAITGDGIGLKTWGTALAISRKLGDLGASHLSHLLTGPSDKFTTAKGKNFTRSEMRVLELGSGTGLVGIATAAIWSCSVLLTDLPDIAPNLSYNVQKNASIVEAAGGTCSSMVLDWANPEGALKDRNETFEVVIAADPLYDIEHPELVANMIKTHLKFDRNSRALAAVPMRDKITKKLFTKFVELMRDNDLQLRDQGEEFFQDDWHNSKDNKGIKCFWSIWAWAIPYQA